MTFFRVGRNKRGDRIQIMLEDARGVMAGYLLTDDEARVLAECILASVRPTATELNSDNAMEP